MISDALIRKESGQYDPEIISKLRLERLSITRIAGLSRCINLVELSLAWNDITEIYGLKDASLLRRLDLSHNRIKTIENLEYLSKLEWFDIRGNDVTSAIDLSGLADLVSLKDLSLQGTGGENANPICKNPRYKEIIQQYASKVTVLDGANLALIREMKDMEDYLECVQVDSTKIEAISTESWLTEADLRVDTSDKGITNELVSNKLFQSSNATQDQIKAKFQEFDALMKKSQAALTDATSRK